MKNPFQIPPKLYNSWPATQIVAVNIITILAPTLSISIPPSKGTTTLGNAYSEYNKLNCA